MQFNSSLSSLATAILLLVTTAEASRVAPGRDLVRAGKIAGGLCTRMADHSQEWADLGSGTLIGKYDLVDGAGPADCCELCAIFGASQASRMHSPNTVAPGWRRWRRPHRHAQ